MTENGKLYVDVLKNGIIIDGGITSSPYGLVSLTGDCDSPDVVDNLKKLNRQ